MSFDPLSESLTGLQPFPGLRRSYARGTNAQTDAASGVSAPDGVASGGHPVSRGEGPWEGDASCDRDPSASPSPPKPDCGTCGGRGWIVENDLRTVPVCCGNLTLAGDCCGDAIPDQRLEQHQVPCPECP